MPSSQTVNVEQYYGLVVREAKRVHRHLRQAGIDEVELRDLIQEGLVRLVEARNRYRSERGVDFAVFAMRYVAGAMKDYLRKLDPLTIRERQKVKQLDRAEQEMVRVLARQPTPDDLAQVLGIAEEEVMRRQSLKRATLSLEEITTSEDGTEEQLLWRLPSPDPGPEQTLMSRQLANDVDDCLETALELGEKRAVILRVLGDLTLQIVARMLEISRSTAHRWEASGLMKLKRCLEKKAWEMADLMAMLP